MKIAIVLSQGKHYFYYDHVVRSLHNMGHEVRIVCPADFSEDGNKSGRALIKLLKEESGIKLEDALLPHRKNPYWVNLLRNLRDYAIFVRPEHPTPFIAPIWIGKELSQKMLKRLELPGIRSFIRSKTARDLFAQLEARIQPDDAILNWFKIFQPQVVFSSPFVFRGDVEVEYAKAAQALKIPVIAALLSWDNLTSKGTYHVMPDKLFVWNQSLVAEAVQIHDFEPQRIFVTGAPVYDPWFDLSPSTDRASFCAATGLDPSKPYVLYLCSSKSISERETELIQMLISHFESVDEKHRPALLVRPHPFKDMEVDGLENEWVKVFPKGGQRPDTDEARSTYYDSLYHCAAVIGVNTTGFLESAILDKPCLTLANSMTSAGQEMRAHFKHLMDAGYIEVAKDFPELVNKTIQIVSGVDVRKENRMKFVRDFIRPHGLNIPASNVMMGAVLAVANGREPSVWMEMEKVI
ncbi:MAG: hypothetical protein J0M11_07560 [Anaerolineae bacterium]|nr:hypothetical protein [Anaerolineae bacterium]